MEQWFWKMFCYFPNMLNKDLVYDPIIPLLSILPGGMKTYVHSKTCSGTFIAALFITAPKWKQPTAL